jgi:thiamine transport system substrate-binding protein
LLSHPLQWRKETLTIYTYDSFVAEWGPGPKVKEAFEKQCDCTLNGWRRAMASPCSTG